MPRTGRPKTAEQIELTCTQCGKPVIRYASTQKNRKTDRVFCSRACLDIAGAKPRRKQDVICAQCGMTFYPRRGLAAVNKYCSKACHDTAQRQGRITETCKVCGTSFEMKPSQARNWTGKYCSWNCAQASRIKRTLPRTHNGRPVIVDSHGYARVWEPMHHSGRKWVHEHRVVVEGLLGRVLRTDEHVHHVNGVKTDNTPENLELMYGPDHCRLTTTVREQREKERIDALERELARYRELYGSLPEES